MCKCKDAKFISSFRKFEIYQACSEIIEIQEFERLETLFFNASFLYFISVHANYSEVPL